MALSTAFLDHFANPANRQHVCVLVEIYLDSTEFLALSTVPYDSGTRLYDDSIVSDVVLAGRIGSAHAVGDFDFVADANNSFRSNDLRGHSCIIRIGDERWDYSSFEIVAQQLVSSIVVKGDNLFTAELTETEFKIDAPLSTELLSGVVLPYALGYVYNAEPVLISEAQLLYAVGNSSMTISSVTVRDNGVVLALGTNYTLNATKTLITFVTAPAGRITCDFVVANTSKVYQATATLLSVAGIATTAADLLLRMRNFMPADPAIEGLEIGLYYSDPSTVTVRNALDTIMEDSGCILRRDAAGLVEISYVNFTNPAYVTDVVRIVSDDIIVDSFAEIGSASAYSNIKIEYSPNQCTQPPESLAGAVSLSNKALFGRQYRAALEDVTGYAGLGGQGTRTKSTSLATQVAANRELQRLKRQHNYPQRKWRLQVMTVGIKIREGDVIGIAEKLLDPADALNKQCITESASHSLTTLLTDLEVIEV